MAEHCILPQTLERLFLIAIVGEPFHSGSETVDKAVMV
jgi:hypothetical protein